MSRKLVIVRRLIAIGSTSVLLGLMAGGCASGGEAQTTPGTGGSAGQAGGGGTSGTGMGGFGGGSGGTTGGAGGAVDSGGAGGAAGDAAAVDGSAGTDGGLAGAGGTGGSGTGGSGGCSSNLESCNGLDDNCNGKIDEGDPGGGDPCTVPNAKGVCAAGHKHCISAKGAVDCVADAQPSNEICDGLDNNCDGQTDEGNPGGNVACNTGLPGICASGTKNCVTGALVCNQNYTALPSEKCNGQDDNCDGNVDEGNPGGGASCNTGKNGVCAVGVTDCQNGQLGCTQVNQPSAETCDGKDNDCNGSIDDNITSVACNSGNQGICAAGHTQCSGGTESCIANINPGSQLEHCDGKDDDCDGTPDNDPVATMCGRDCPGNPTTFPHVNSIACNSACSIPAGGCAAGYHDNDGNYCNGCEKNYCSQNPVVNSCAAASTVAVPSNSTGQIITKNAAVWYKVKFAKPSPGSNFNPRIQLTQGGSEYRMDVLANCSTAVTCPGAGGSLPGGSVKNGSDITDWSMNFASSCQSSTCKTDHSTVPTTLYVKITRTSIPSASSGNPSPECDQFTLAVSK